MIDSKITFFPELDILVTTFLDEVIVELHRNTIHYKGHCKGWALKTETFLVPAVQVIAVLTTVAVRVQACPRQQLQIRDHLPEGGPDHRGGALR